MSAEPITREQLRRWAGERAHRGYPEHVRAPGLAVIALLDDHAVAASLRGRVQNALALVYDHTRHEGFTPADDLALHERVVAEIQTALDLTRPAP